MKHNLGSVDRGIRLIVGLALMALAATGVVGWWGWLGVILPLTAAINWCPIYSVLGLSTSK